MPSDRLIPLLLLVVDDLHISSHRPGSFTMPFYQICRELCTHILLPIINLAGVSSVKNWNACILWDWSTFLSQMSDFVFSAGCVNIKEQDVKGNMSFLKAGTTSESSFYSQYKSWCVVGSKRFLNAISRMNVS